jgi:serine/threonine protein kinase
VETGQVIQRRYLLQRLVQQGPTCAVYQGFDQVLQRTIALKSATVEHMSAYRAAIRATGQFTHPNIIGIYDLIIDAEALYIVQEFVDGDDFGTLLQSQLAPYYVVDFGVQICQALMYASSSARKICHGDLTPSAIIRDHRGLVHINNFALPPDTNYFARWNIIGGKSTSLSDPGLPVGKGSEGRYADDTRALGLLMYQLLTAGRNPDARVVEPPADGRLRFNRNTPPEICEIVARTLIPQHPEYIGTLETLHSELKVMMEALELAQPYPVAVAPVPAPAYQTQLESQAQTRLSQFAPGRSGGLISQPLVLARSDADYAQQVDFNGSMVAVETNSASTNFDPMLNAQLASARQAAYGTNPEIKHVNLPMLILIGLVFFALFFGIGYYLSTLIIH